MRKKCPVCGLYVGKKPHSGAVHDAIRANRRRIGAIGRVKLKIPRRFRPRI